MFTFETIEFFIGIDNLFVANPARMPNSAEIELYHLLQSMRTTLDKSPENVGTVHKIFLNNVHPLIYSCSLYQDVKVLNTLNIVSLTDNAKFSFFIFHLFSPSRHCCVRWSVIGESVPEQIWQVIKFSNKLYELSNNFGSEWNLRTRNF